MDIRDYNHHARDHKVEQGRLVAREGQTGGQLDAGFVLTALYEDRDSEHPLARLLPTFIATRGVKPR
jgi:hypothetical protein